MDTPRILTFLKEVAANNHRDWFLAHKADYLACKADFERGVDQLIAQLSVVDPEIAHLTSKDCCYRFNRDTRFSTDKSPYKRHFGAYICAHGKKALRGGYYIHLQPGRCFFSVGSYWLPTNILTSVRNEILGQIELWRAAVENKDFITLYGKPNEGKMTEEEISPKGFGITCLKTAPKGFDKADPAIAYLRMKDYATWHCVPDNFFQGDIWLAPIVEQLSVAQPMMNFVNSVVDDYE